ncbi:hypothetical protein M0R45_008895 [Rubus argutus]|uniref:Uncharacterized protein n=1 Tax=Rubus argutus TaxID=59490 RepID=A0AAW1Y3F2_RUBAR
MRLKKNELKEEAEKESQKPRFVGMMILSCTAGLVLQQQGSCLEIEHEAGHSQLGRGQRGAGTATRENVWVEIDGGAVHIYWGRGARGRGLLERRTRGAILWTDAVGEVSMVIGETHRERELVAAMVMAAAKNGTTRQVIKRTNLGLWLGCGSDGVDGLTGLSMVKEHGVQRLVN